MSARKVARKSSARRPASPKRALRMWGPSVKMWLSTVQSEAADGMTAAGLLQKMAAGADPLDKSHIELLARQIFSIFAKAGDAARTGASMFDVVERGGWEGGAL